MMKNLGCFDVVVLGGGPTGVMAAVAAARSGASVALVEEAGFVGGMAATGLPLLTYHNAYGDQVIKGLADELVQRLVESSGSVGHLERPREHFGKTITPVDGEMVKFEMMNMIVEAGVELYLHASAFGVVTRNDKIVGVCLYSESEIYELSGKVFIDATGDADIARKACVPSVNSLYEGHQPATLMFQVGGVDLDEVAKEMNEELIIGRKLGEDEESIVCIQGNFGNWDEEVFKENLFPDSRHAIWFTSVRRGLVDINCTRLIGLDPLDIRGRTKGQIDGRFHILRIIDFMRRHMRSFANAWVTQVSPLLGVRDTYHIQGEYCLTKEDVIEGRMFDDTIAIGGYAIDLHDPEGDGIMLSPVNKKGYGIPYRTMIPLNIDGLIVAGRSICSEPIPFASFRVMAQCMAMGEAAGMAAALAAQRGEHPRNVDGKVLRERLVKNGACVSVG